MVSAVSSQVASLGSGPIPFGAGATANTGATDSSANASPSANGTATAQGTPASTAADQKLEDALQALKTLRAQSVSASAADKTAALQKLERLKQQLRALQEFGGDPKTTAREAAAIAKQIADAAQDYAAAGGDPSGAGVGSTIAEAASNAPRPDAATGQTTAGSSAGAVEASTGSSQAGDTSPTPAASSSPIPPTGPAAEAGGSQNPTVNADHRTATTAPNAPSGSPSASAPSSADQDFFNEAKALAKQAKDIIAAAIHALRATHQKIDPNIASAADDAQAQVRQSEDQSSESGLQVVANLAQPPSAPSISVTA